MQLKTKAKQIEIDEMVNTNGLFHLPHNTLEVKPTRSYTPIGVINNFLVAKQRVKLEREKAQNAVIGKAIRCGYGLQRNGLL